MHLVTTALREFWPESGPIWLLTPGCLPDPTDPEVRDRWDIKGIVTDPWQFEPEMTAAYAEIWNITHELIGLPANRLNAIHKTGHSERYWRTLIGLWALLFVTVLYDRHARLLKARSEIEHVKVIGCSENNPIIPSDTFNFGLETADDLYNCQIYTFLCGKLGIPIVEHRAAKKISGSESVHLLGPSLVERCLQPIFKFGNDALSCALARRSDVLMVASYLPRWFEIALSFATSGKVFRLPSQIPMAERSGSQIDGMARAALSGIPEGYGGIKALIVETVKMCIPRVFVEDYQQVYSSTDRAYGNYRPKAIYSANAWYFNEPFKHWAAKCQEEGTRLIGGAHGASYLVRKHGNCESFEILLSDRYLTWGWSSAQEPKLVPTPACKLIHISRRSRRVSGNGILYVGTAEPRHNVMFLANFSDYLEWQRRFFASVPESCTKDFLVRLHNADFEWKNRERLAKVAPDLRFDTWEVSFRDRLKRCRVFVCDHLSTTYAEALAANVPTILFWDEARYPIRDTAIPYVQALKDCHILHADPESAAAWLTKTYGDPAPWWLSGSCQKAVKDFCHVYARTSAKPLRDWKRILTAFAGR